MSLFKRPQSSKSQLDSLLNEIRNPPSVPKAETKFSEASMLNTLAHSLSQCKSLDGGEFEIRFGIQSNGRFQAGFKKEHFRKLTGILQEAASDIECKKSVDYFYSWKGIKDQHARFECNENGLTIQRVVLKSRQCSFDFFDKPGMTYDFRAVLSNETVLHGIAEFPKDAHPIRRRKKTRAIFTFNDHPWRFELTTVQEHSYDSNQDSTCYEVEIELDQAFMIRMTNAHFIENQAKLLENLIKTYNKFDFILSDIKPCSVVPSSPSSILLPITNIQLKVIIRKEVNDLMGIGSNYHGFPGAMPFALTRSNMKNLSVSTHMVTWKADGERFFLCIFPKNGVYLINRKYDIYDLNESHPQFASMMTSAFVDKRVASSILDGEIVFNKLTNKFEFVIFDMISCNGAKTWYDPYTKRIELARKMLNNAADHIDPVTYQSLTLNVTVKDCHEINQLSTLRQKICQTGTNSFVANGAYDCDGVVFIPTGPYVPRLDPNMLKVKLSLEQITLDFEITPLGKENETDKRWGFYCIHDRQLLLCREQTMDAAQNQLCDSLLIQYEVERRSKADLRLIVECYYHRGEGIWKVLKRRADKNIPNSFSVYCETMETLVQGMVVDSLFN